MGEQSCGLPGPMIDFSVGDVAITASIEEGDSCYYVVEIDSASDELDVQVSSGVVRIYDQDLQNVDSVAGLTKFFIFTETSADFEVTTGGIGNTQEKVVINVDENGDEAIDEIIDIEEEDQLDGAE